MLDRELPDDGDSVDPHPPMLRRVAPATSDHERRRPAALVTAVWLMWTQAAFAFAGLAILMVKWGELTDTHGREIPPGRLVVTMCLLALSATAFSACVVMLQQRARRARLAAIAAELTLLLPTVAYPGTGDGRGFGSASVIVILALICLSRKSVRAWCDQRPSGDEGLDERHVRRGIVK